MPKLKKAEITLEYSNYILQAPAPPASLRQTAESNDKTTIDFWREKWIANIKANKAKYGSFSERSVGKLFQKHLYQPMIIAGSGPSLVRNGHELRDRGGIPLISCLHNFHYFIDQGVDVEYYVTLDAGELPIAEVSEGGTKNPEEYWALTKGKTLLAYIGTHPKLLEKWQGDVYFFNCQIPNLQVEEEVTTIEKFWADFSVGGNVLGACLYAAKALFGASIVAFIGADFSFSYEKKFHGWKSSYDANLGQVLRAIDVFGNAVYTWPSYHGFRCFFEWVAQVVPGVYVNCTEGGTFGAYPEGNLIAVRQMDLCDFIGMLRMSESVRETMTDPAGVKTRVTLY